ncbi:hypothetical protein [Winogradskyella sp.]
MYSFFSVKYYVNIRVCSNLFNKCVSSFRR